MAQQERKSPGGTQDVEEIRRKRKTPEPVAEKLKAQGSELNPFSAILESPMGKSSLERHAALLGDARFSDPANIDQKARIVSQLQQNYGNAYVQRVVSSIQTNRDEEVTNGELPGDIAQRIAGQRGSGQPLSPETSSQTEESLGRDLSNVRMHTDATADRLAKKLGARAFTTGKDVFFREGAYEPDSETGKRLLDHELAHVVQESGSTPQFPIKITDPSGPAETEAEAVSHTLAIGKDVSVVPRVEMAGAIARQPVEVKPEEEVVEIHPEAAPAKPPPATPAPPLPPAVAALGALWDTTVVGPLGEAKDVLSARGSPRVKASKAYPIIKRSIAALDSVLPNYKESKPKVFGEMAWVSSNLTTIVVGLKAHFGARESLEELSEHLTTRISDLKRLSGEL